MKHKGQVKVSDGLLLPKRIILWQTAHLVRAEQDVTQSRSPESVIPLGFECQGSSPLRALFSQEGNLSVFEYPYV